MVCGHCRDRDPHDPGKDSFGTARALFEPLTRDAGVQMLLELGPLAIGELVVSSRGEQRRRERAFPLSLSGQDAPPSAFPVRLDGRVLGCHHTDEANKVVSVTAFESVRHLGCGRGCFIGLAELGAITFNCPGAATVFRKGGWL
jgi:hypothetical protein